jgi:hypothetical protein
MEEIREITARLRGHYCMSPMRCTDLALDAAAEIERLQAQVADLEKLVMNVAMRCVRDPDTAAEIVADERWLIGS